VVRNRPIYRLKVADRYGRNVTGRQTVTKEGGEFGVERIHAWSSDVSRKVSCADRQSHKMWLELKKPWAGETRNVEKTLLDANERIIETDLISF